VGGTLSEQDLVVTDRATIGPLYAYVSRRVGGDVSLAEDVVQDTWMRAIRRGNNMESRSERARTEEPGQVT
jgi:DNA-directed RNA polymerase specialized sigma24 family protein